MSNYTKTVVMLIGNFVRLVEWWLLIGSLNFINAGDQPLNGKHLMVLPVEVSLYIYIYIFLTVDHDVFYRFLLKQLL